MIHYYLTIFPTEALIASQLEPEEFGVYMATGTRRGTAERLMFIELRSGNFSGVFDWAYAEESCRRAEAEGVRRRSAYLSVYRTLEQVPTQQLGKLYLVTRDGRNLALEAQNCHDCDKSRPAYLYQELCPTRPLVVSNQHPCAFIQHITNPVQKIHMPAVAVADMELPRDLNAEDLGNLLYHNVAHLRDCLEALSANKAVKVVDRQSMVDFDFGHIASGVYVGSSDQVVKYTMPDNESIKRNHYEWARSAMLI
jgi:hypothetical protein